MMFNNSANIGLPLALLAWGEEALPAVFILFMVENTLRFSPGVRMTDVSLCDWRLATGSAVLRPLAGIAIGAGLFPMLGLQDREAAILLVFGALPPAVLNFLVAERYQQEPERVGSLVLIRNLTALILLPLTLALVLE